MANLLLVIDPDGERLALCVDQSKAHIAPFPGLLVDAKHGANCALVWAVSPTAPLSVIHDDRGLAFVLGEAMDETGRRLSAMEVRAAWEMDSKACWDGFYLAGSVSEAGELAAGGDLLGLMPFYHWQGGGVTLVATSPELFLAHPAFRPEFDVEGLVRVLLINGLAGGLTLYKGVRRVQPGHHLRTSRGCLEEHEAFRIPDRLDLAHLPLEGHVEILGEAVQDAMRRHAAPGHEYGLLLSGGLDSRMVGGLLLEAGIRPRTFSIGLAEDLEMRCAKAAAKALGVEQIIGEPSAQDYPEYARIHSDYEHLANGFNTIRDWWTQTKVGQLGDRIATGIYADALIGGTTIHWAYSSSPARMSFDGFWHNMAQMGLPPDIARSLLRPEWRGLVDSAMAALRQEYEGYGDLGSYQAWRFDLAHGERYHVGATLWRLAFGAWPTQPMLDRRVIEVASSIPASSLAHRAAQLELVRSRMPALRHVPLDRSDLLELEAQFLEPRLLDLAKERVLRQVGRVRRRLTRQDPRYWYRVNDFNSNHWRTVRHGAEPHRAKLETWFDRSRLSELLPPPDGIHSDISESARKLLLGFMHWSSNHL